MSKKDRVIAVSLGAGLFLIAALFSISILFGALNFGGPSRNVLQSFGGMLVAVYGICSILIPVFFFVAGAMCLSANWSFSRALVLLVSLVPFFTLVVTEKIVRNIAAVDKSPVAFVKIVTLLVISFLLVAAEFLLTLVAAGMVEERLRYGKKPDFKKVSFGNFKSTVKQKLSVLKSKSDDVEETVDIDSPVKTEVSKVEEKNNATPNVSPNEETSEKTTNVLKTKKKINPVWSLDENGDAPKVPQETAEETKEPEEKVPEEPSEPAAVENSPKAEEETKVSEFAVPETTSLLLSEEEAGILNIDEMEFDDETSVPEEKPAEEDEDDDIIASFEKQSLNLKDDYVAPKVDEKIEFEMSFEEPVLDETDLIVKNGGIIEYVEEKTEPSVEETIKDVIRNVPEVEPQFPDATKFEHDTYSTFKKPVEENVTKTLSGKMASAVDNIFSKMEIDARKSLSENSVESEEIAESEESADSEYANEFDSNEEIPSEVSSINNANNESNFEIDETEPDADFAEEIDGKFDDDLEISEIAEEYPEIDDESDEFENDDEEFDENFAVDEDSMDSDEMEDTENFESDGEESLDIINDDFDLDETDESDDIDEEIDSADELEEDAEDFDDNRIDPTAPAIIDANGNLKQGTVAVETKEDGTTAPIKVTPKRITYKNYSIDTGILKQYDENQYWIIDDETRQASLSLKETLSEFKINAEVTGIVKGPVVTMFELLPAAGVKLSRIVALADNIALRLAASSIRIVAPIPGKRAVGIEVPNKNRAIVSFRECIEQERSEWKKMGVPVVLGKDIQGETQIMDLVKTPHLLIAGSTGAGKSVCVNSMILSILCKRSPSEVKLIMIDPKVVELKLYNGIAHLLTPVITEPKKAMQALQYALCEMERRYAVLDGMGCRDIVSYNNKIKEKNIATEKLPYIVIVIDEFADLMTTTGKAMEQVVARLCAMSRAVGIHLVLATQRPSIDVITGLIKANIPSRIAFMVASKTDSRIIIDQVGAEKLLGKGDMLYASATDPFPVRIQGALISDQEVEDVVEAVKEWGEPDYIDDEIFVDDEDEAEGENMALFTSNGEDPLYDKAVDIVIQAGKASASYIQRRLSIGYNRAARLVEEMEERGIVGPANGSKPREIIRMP